MGIEVKTWHQHNQSDCSRKMSFKMSDVVIARPSRNYPTIRALGGQP
jgi:hypothetical protein